MPSRALWETAMSWRDLASKSIQRARQVADVSEPSLKHLLLAVFDDVARAISPGEIRVAIRSSKLADAFAKTKGREIEGLFGAHFAKIRDSVVRQVIPTAFNAGHRRSLTVVDAAAQYAERFSATHLTGITLETEEAVRQVIAYGMRNGKPINSIAQDLQSQVGLTKRHQQAVVNHRDMMLREGNVPRGQVEAMSRAYAQRLKSHRAQMIARTEVMNALNIGRLTVWSSAINDGTIPSTARKVWVTADDERTCPACAPMHGVTVPFGEAFDVPYPKGKAMMLQAPPPHPQCRCIVDLVT